MARRLRLLALACTFLGLCSATAAHAADGDDLPPAAVLYDLPGEPIDLPLAPSGLAALDALIANDGSCGGAGQVPCMRWDWCAWRGLFNECWGGLVLDQPFNGCDSDRLSNWGLVCVACGSTGQPQCSLGASCNQPAAPGLGQRHTAAGLCYACGGSGQAACVDGTPCDPGTRNILGFCAYSGFSSEPSTNSSVNPGVQPPDQPLYGFANLHTHQFANLGFGGAMFWGAAFDWRGINSALAWCDYTWDFSTTNHLNLPNPPVVTLGYEVHGPIGFNALGDPVESAAGVGSHPVGGTGPFDGWPTFDQVTHQQMYYKWVERAYQGGQRLMVMDAVSNEILCRGGKRRSGWGCNDMENVDRQIQGAKELEYFVDVKDDGHVNGSGWYRIAYSAAQARQIVRNGKMAVVLGIEVDTLFNCSESATGMCTDSYIRDQVRRYYNLGVRHIFPIHEFDNAFGGSALFHNFFNVGNYITAGHYFNTVECGLGGYTYNIESDAMAGFIGFLLFGVTAVPPPYPGATECNARGLTPAGAALINALMDQKMIIDVDHMSHRMLEGSSNPEALDGVFKIAESRHYPLISSHTSFLGVNAGSEFALAPSHLTRIRDLGGIIGPGVPRGKCGTADQFAAWYQYGKTAMSGGPYWGGTDDVIGLALSTDTNGTTQQTGPRFGVDALGCPPTTQAMLQYPFAAQDGSGLFWQQQTGSKTFDYNFDGMAHMGLLPDFLADVRRHQGRTAGLTDAELNPLFRSAEAFIRMWERIDTGQLVPPPTVTPTITGTAGANGWYTSDVAVSWTIDSQSDIVDSDGCEDRTISSDTTGVVITCRASNDDGGETVGSVTIRRDTAPPTVSAVRLTPANAHGWNNGPVDVEFTATDGTSGVSGAPKVVRTVTGEGADQSVTFVFSDQAGLTHTTALGNINIDRTPPRLGFQFANLPANAPTADVQAEQARWHNRAVEFRVSADDELSGIEDPPQNLVLSTEGAAVSGSATATDKAGNSVTASSDPVKIDLTAPTIDPESRLPAANGAGWNNSDVTVAWTCGDTLSGPASSNVTAVVTGEGANLSSTGTCHDVAGNSAANTRAGINIDRTRPVITHTQLPAANSAGWNRTDVLVTFSATDVLSGLAGAASASSSIATEGVGLSATHSFTDLAGNTASATHGGVKIDKTAPTLTFAAASPVANAAGWNNTHVTFAFRTADSLSGVKSASMASPLVLTGEGSAVSGAVTVLDVADNAATFVSPPVRIDKTAPVVECSIAPAVLWPANRKMVPVSVALTFTDALSGTESVALVTAESNEPAAGDIAFTIGSPATTGALRAVRAGAGDGRTYTLGYRGIDRAGNVSSCTTTAVVPHHPARR